MQFELPMFSQWHQCLDLANYPPSQEPCDAANIELWSLWCRMKNRPLANTWGLWTEKDVVDWVNATIAFENSGDELLETIDGI